MRSALRTTLILSAAAATVLGTLAASPALAGTPTPSHPSGAPSSATTKAAPGIRDLGDDGIVVPELGDTMEASRTAAAATRAAATGPRVDRVFVVVVNVTSTSADNEYTTSDLSDTNIRAAIGEVADFWEGESKDAVTFGVAGIERTSLHALYCDPTSVFYNQQAKAFNGHFAGNKWQAAHDHLLILTSEGDSCGGYAGFGYIGTGNGVIFSANGLDEQYGVPVLRHEFGHNLGFAHADSTLCKNTSTFDDYLDQYKYSGGHCVVEPYGDFLDIMGYTVEYSSPHLSTIERIRAGWMTSGVDYRTLSSSTPSTTTTLANLDTASGWRAVRVIDPRSGEMYVLEYRTASGRDADSLEFWGDGQEQCTSTVNGQDGQGNPMTIDMGSFARCYGGMSTTAGGIRILRDMPTYGHESANMAVGLTADAPTNKYQRNSFLVAGQSFTSGTGGFTVVVNSTDGTASGASITVSFAAKAQTTVSLTSNRITQKYGTSTVATLSAHVTSINGVYPRGTMALYDGTRRLKTLSVSTTTGTMSYRLPQATSVGKHSYTVKFTAYHSGYLASTSKAKVITVSR